MGEKKAVELTIQEEFNQKIKAENRKTKIIKIAPLMVLVLLVAVFGIISHEFVSLQNLLSIITQLSIPLILSLGVTFIILMGGIDLSVEGVMALAGCIMSLLVLNTKTGLELGVLGILISILVGVVFGCISGFIYVKLRLPSFMVTFGISGIAGGVALLSYGGIPAKIQSPLIESISFNSFIGIPILTWFAIVIFIIAYLLQEYSAFGRYVFAIGDDETIPRVSGINVDRIKIWAFIWAGFCFGVAGCLGAARLSLGTLLIGQGYLFPTIAAVVVGGTALSGGRGGVVNTLIGALIITVLQNGLILLGVNPYIQSALQGIIIVGAVALSVVRGKKVVNK